MAEMVCSALVQEGVSRAVSSVLCRREEKASQWHIRERLEMAASELGFALERSAKLPITDVSLLERRKRIKLFYVEATELLDKHKQKALQSQDVPWQRTKRKLWMVCSKETSPGLSMEDVRRIEWYADCAGKFVRDVESGCSLRHYTFCNPLVRHLLEGKTLLYRSMEQGNPLREFYMWPTSSEERGVEAMLGYVYEDRKVAEKSFGVLLIIRLSESTDIAGVAIKCLQLLTSQFKLDAESAVGELTLLANIQDVSHSYELPWASIQEEHIKWSASRPDPACCKASRHGLCAVNSVSSSAVEYSLSSSPHEGGPSVSRGRRAPLEVRVGILPHDHGVSCNEDEYGCYALEIIGNKVEECEFNLQQGADTVRSKAINCFFRQPDLMDYRMFWYSRHGGGWFIAEKPSPERAGAPKTRRRYNTRASAKGMR